jgi:dipeptidyl aminopeptidase/acylaminoacyl peptidase
MNFKNVSLSVILLSLVMISKAQKTPLLDRDLFFGNPEISGGQLSPDGKWISFMKEYEGIMNIWVKKFDEPFNEARPLTNSKRPMYGYFWTKDGKYILYVKDKDGDENINVFAVDPLAKASENGVPESRNLTPLNEVTAQIYAVSENNSDLLMIGLNDRDKAWHDLYSLEISTGKLTLKYENNDRITGYDFDWDDNLRLLNRTDEGGNTTIFNIEKDGALSPIYDFQVTEQAYIAGWNEDNSLMYLVTNKGDLNLSTLYLMNPKTKELKLIESDPNKKVDFGNLRLDKNTRKIISTSYTHDKQKVYWKNDTWKANYEFLQKKFPGREIGFQSATSDYSKFLVSVYGDKFAAESYFFDAKSKELIFQYTPRPALKKVEEHLSEMKPISYKSSDGLEIPAYLSLPKGLGNKNLPLVVLVHGGPKGPRDYWGYDPIVQFLNNRGYAVLQPNFRASGGYGKNFLNAGDLQWGKLMQDDITWGVQYLIHQGIADKNKVAIMGGSYGGYATLAGLAFTPELYACGVDIVGPSNIFTLLESVPAYWEAGRAFLYGMVGDPNTEEGKKLIKEASPLFSADKINKPLLIIQGANDPRVKKAEADQIAIAMRDKRKQVNYLLADDEGHGFSKPVNKMAMFAEIEKFLSEILGGRYQKEMPEDVAKRLKEITVDINTVTYDASPKANSVEKLPSIKNLLKVGEINYDMMIEVQGQKIPMTTKRTVTKEGENWIVKEESKGMMGESSDIITYDASLKAIKRNIKQAGQDIKLDFKSDKIVLAMMAKEIEIATPNEYLNDGPGLDVVIAGLSLKKDYQMVVDMPDMTGAKVKQMTLKVVGEETIEGKNCWKVELINNGLEAEKGTMWISKDENLALKSTQVLPAMGNALITVTKK